MQDVEEEGKQQTYLTITVNYFYDFLFMDHTK